MKKYGETPLFFKFLKTESVWTDLFVFKIFGQNENVWTNLFIFKFLVKMRVCGLESKFRRFLLLPFESKYKTD